MLRLLFVHLSHLVPFICLSDDAPHIFLSLLLYVKTPLSALPFPPFVWFKQVVLEELVLPCSRLFRPGAVYRLVH